MPFRSLRKRSPFLSLGALTLSLAVGANALVYSIVQRLWAQGELVPDPDGIVTVLVDTGGGGTEVSGFGEGAVRPLEDLGIFQRVAGQISTAGLWSSAWRPRIQLEAEPGRRLEVVPVTVDYFKVLGLPILGRDFAHEDNVPGQGRPVAILSHALWHRAFGGRPEVLGTLVPASPMPLQIIGVAPAGFQGARLGERIDLWIPSQLTRDVTPLHRSGGRMLVLARLRPAVSVRQAEQILTSRSDELFPGLSRARYEVVPIAKVYGSTDHSTAVISPDRLLWFLWAMSLLVLLAGCGTLAGLVLVHYTRRRQELAIRVALGCSSRRLAIGLAGELLTLFLAGGLGALAIVWIGLQLLPAIRFPDGIDLSRLQISIDWRVVAVAALASGLTLIAAVSWPLVRATRPHLSGDLASSPRGARGVSHRGRALLLCGQAALTTVLLVTSGLFVRTVSYAYHHGTGLDVDRTLFVDVHIGHGAQLSKPERESREIRLKELGEAVGRRPGVHMVAFGRSPIGFDQASEARLTSSGANIAGAGYFDVIGVPIIAGLWPDTRPGAPALERQLAVTQSLAAARWPGVSPLGRESSGWTVVAVVSDMVQGSVRLPSRRGSFRFTDAAEAVAMSPYFHLAIRATVDPAAVQDAVRRLVGDAFPEAALIDVRTGRELVAEDVGRERLGALLFSAFGVVALGLSISGVVGIVAQLVAGKRREFGVRMALGATPFHLVRLAVGAGLWPVASGVLAGLLGAVALSSLVREFLLGVHRLEPSVYLGAAAVVTASALVAGLVPALRLRVLDPGSVLREP